MKEGNGTMYQKSVDGSHDPAQVKALLEGPTYGESVDGSLLSDADQSVLNALNRRSGVVRDRVRGVARRRHNGFYLYGRPGTGKTHTVEQTLRTEGATFFYHQGRLTPMGLFELLAEQHDRVIVLDDVAEIFKQPNALQLLLAALGSSREHSGERIVRYRRQGLEETFRFSGGIICISNLELHTAPLLDALRSRVHYLKYDPTEDQMAALMRNIASKGWFVRGRALSPRECLDVADFLVAEATRLGCRLDLRLLVEKAIPDYLQFRAAETETHWKDLVTSTLQEHLVEPNHPPVAGGGIRRSQKEADQQIASEIRSEYATKQEQVRAWKEQTGKSERAYYRRLGEMSS